MKVKIVKGQVGLANGERIRSRVESGVGHAREVANVANIADASRTTGPVATRDTESVIQVREGIGEAPRDLYIHKTETQRSWNFRDRMTR